MSGKGDLSTFAVVFMEEAAKAGYTDPLNCEVIAVSTTDYLPKMPLKSSSSDKAGKHEEKEGYMVMSIILIMGLICVCHIVTDKEHLNSHRYQRIPKSILGELGGRTHIVEGITSWSVASDQDLGAEDNSDDDYQMDQRILTEQQMLEIQQNKTFSSTTNVVNDAAKDVNLTASMVVNSISGDDELDADVQGSLLRCPTPFSGQIDPKINPLLQ